MANTKRGLAFERLQQLRGQGYTDTDILDHVIDHFLSGDDACDALQSFADEYDITFDGEEEEEANEAEEEEEEEEEEEGLSGNEIKVKPLGRDSLGRDVYESLKDGQIYKAEIVGIGYYKANSFDGEPESTVSDDVKIVIVTEEDPTSMA